MDSDLKSLEQKLANLITQYQNLRNENVQLRQELTTMESDTALLKTHMAQASERIEALMKSLP